MLFCKVNQFMRRMPQKYLLLHVLTYTINEFGTDSFIHESGWYMHNTEDLNNGVITCAESFYLSTVHIFTLVKLPYFCQLT